MKRKALGRGLSALIPESPKPASKETRAADYFVCPIEQIYPQKNQPRHDFNEDDLAELIASITEFGVLQPILVRPGAQDGKFEIIAGERRWRAAQRAGIRDVPIVIRQTDDQNAFELALVENIQRAQLNPIEEAVAYARLIEDHNHTQEAVAQRVGKNRTTITNAIRLLKLTADSQRALVQGRITGGHARALLALKNPRLERKTLKRVLDKDLSVRQTEMLTKRLLNPQDSPSQRSPKVNVSDLEQRMTQALKTRVRLHQRSKGNGHIEVSYGSLDELDRLLEVLLRG